MRLFLNKKFTVCDIRVFSDQRNEFEHVYVHIVFYGIDFASGEISTKHFLRTSAPAPGTVYSIWTRLFPGRKYQTELSCSLLSPIPAVAVVTTICACSPPLLLV